MDGAGLAWQGMAWRDMGRGIFFLASFSYLAQVIELT